MKKSELRRELERLAVDEADSDRAKLAKIEALRLLERLDRAGDIDYPVDDDGRFHPGGPSGGTSTAAMPTKSGRGGGSAFRRDAVDSHTQRVRRTLVEQLLPERFENLGSLLVGHLGRMPESRNRS